MDTVVLRDIFGGTQNKNSIDDTACINIYTGVNKYIINKMRVSRIIELNAVYKFTIYYIFIHLFV